jgi:hypothetical protein
MADDAQSYNRMHRRSMQDETPRLSGLLEEKIVLVVAEAE